VPSDPPDDRRAPGEHRIGGRPWRARIGGAAGKARVGGAAGKARVGGAAGKARIGGAAGKARIGGTARQAGARLGRCRRRLTLRQLVSIRLGLSPGERCSVRARVSHVVVS